MTLKAVIPCRPVAPYIGGKVKLAKDLSRIISATPHSIYAECFVGMGGVFFRRTQRPDVEIINDFSGDVATLFRVLQRHYQPFLDMIRWRLSSRAEFERLLAMDGRLLTDLERAARFVYIQRLCYGGKINGRVFGVAPDRPARFDLTRLVPMLEDVHDRLSGVVIECLDYKEFIPRYDGPDVLFYLDPPYYGCEGDYGRESFSRDEFPAMARILSGIKGRFILSLNDHPEVRGIFSEFIIRQINTSYSISGAHKTVSEVLISNFDSVNLHTQEALL